MCLTCVPLSCVADVTCSVAAIRNMVTSQAGNAATSRGINCPQTLGITLLFILLFLLKAASVFALIVRILEMALL